MKPAEKLRALIAAPGIIMAPGIYDAFSAFRAQEAGFPAAFVSGSALAAMHLGRPDIGLLSLGELESITGRIADRVSIPLIVDADQGYGNAYLAARTMQLLERAGASGIQIEDQQRSKPTAAPQSRPLIPLSDMLDKLKAVLDARRDEATIVSARTDAMVTEGIDVAIDRAAAFAEVGADLVFVESLGNRADLQRLARAIGGKAPLVHNMLRYGHEVNDVADLQALGFKIALFPQVAAQAAGAALDAAFASLIKARTIPDPGEQPDRLGTADYLASIQSTPTPR